MCLWLKGRSCRHGAVLELRLEWLIYRSPRFERFFQPPPLLLIENGRMLPKNMRSELITKDELLTKLREEGIAELSDVKEACMESDGMISVIKVDRRPCAAN
jgi:uncharacterized membrane protein YcaP (DUF421 family)